MNSPRNHKNKNDDDDDDDDRQSCFKICGRAFTVKMVFDNGDKTTKSSKETHYLDTVERDSIVVISAPHNSKNAVWGGLMTARAKVLGLRGVIIDGRCRDLRDHDELDFPVFARGNSVLGQSTFTKPTETQEPLTIYPSFSNMSKSYQSQRVKDERDDESDQNFEPVTINPNDIIMADQDGVVRIPKDLIDQVLKLCKVADEVEKNCLRYILSGHTVTETFEKFRSTKKN
ncbi:ribonuclease E inhibitor RraA/Dimethylmenaquinone methyltransferase [Phakopsora pachyrhizi]|nr:ribonuclease E inhibitor RraA/Dimethylmenaquinone methyltransferase [Phakopsora pachyrhizi]